MALKTAKQSRRKFLNKLGRTAGFFTASAFWGKKADYLACAKVKDLNDPVGKKQSHQNIDIQTQSGWGMLPRILSRIKPPTFQNKCYDVTSYGATRDGSTDCRQAFFKAIKDCHLAGGGQVAIPSGRYLINGPLYLKSNVNLHLNKKAILIFGTNPKDYLTGKPEFNGCVLVRWEGLWCYNYSPLIYAWKEENVAITGEGTIDGQTDKFWSEWYIRKLHQPDRIKLRQMGRDMVPVEKRIFGPGHHLAPGTIELCHCRNVLIEGITTRMPLERTVHPVFCENITVRNVTIQAGVLKARNDDGIDPDSCKEVLIEKCTIHNYDDGIALKSGRAKEGWPEQGGSACENVIIRNNVFLGEHNGVSIGSDMSGGVRNIFVYDCQFGVGNKQQYVFNAKSNCDRGGVIENIYFKNIQIDSCLQLMRMEMEYKDIKYDPVEHPFPPQYQNLYFEGITCQNAEEYGINITGLEQSFVREIYLKDITITKAKTAMNMHHVNRIICDNVIINGLEQKSIY